MADDPERLGKEALLHSRWGQSGDSPALWESSYLKSITGWCTSEAFGKDENFSCLTKYVHFPPKTSQELHDKSRDSKVVRVSQFRGRKRPNLQLQRIREFLDKGIILHTDNWVLPIPIQYPEYQAFFFFSLRPHHFITHLTSLDYLSVKALNRVHFSGG